MTFAQRRCSRAWKRFGDKVAIKSLSIRVVLTIAAVQSEKYSLLRATAKTFLWPLLAGVFPRLCQTGFTYAQPFLINALITHIDSPEKNGSSNVGYALIGAYILVFFGAAVSSFGNWHFLSRSLLTRRVLGFFRSILTRDDTRRHQDSWSPYCDDLFEDAEVSLVLSGWNRCIYIDEHRC